MLKAGLDGRLPYELLTYAAKHPVFPRDSTGGEQAARAEQQPSPDGGARSVIVAIGRAGGMLTEQDSGREVGAAVGEQVQVTLKENPTAGYGWAVASLTPGVLELEGSRFSLPAGTGVGGGGRRTFTFRAAAAGRALLELELRRRWERPGPPEARFSLTVQVR